MKKRIIALCLATVFVLTSSGNCFASEIEGSITENYSVLPEETAAEETSEAVFDEAGEAADDIAVEAAEAIGTAADEMGEAGKGSTEGAGAEDAASGEAGEAAPAAAEAEDAASGEAGEVAPAAAEAEDEASGEAGEGVPAAAEAEDAASGEAGEAAPAATEAEDEASGDAVEGVPAAVEAEDTASGDAVLEESIEEDAAEEIMVLNLEDDVVYNDNLEFDNMREADGFNTYIFLNEEYTTNVKVSEDITSQYENLSYNWAVYYRDGNADEQEVYNCYDTFNDEPTKIIINGTGLNHCVGREDRSYRAEVTIMTENYEVVAKGGFVIHVASTVNELDTIDDIQLLRCWEYKVPNTLHKYVKNADYPYGKEFDLTVTGVTVENRYNDGDPVCGVETAADGWIIRANNVQGTATATVSYNDENGQSDSYEFFVAVAGDIVEFEYSYQRGTCQMPQSSTMDISTAAKHTWNYGQYGAGDEYLKDYTVAVEDESFGNSYDHNLITVSIKEDGKTICVQSNGINGECDIKIRLTAEYGNGGTWSQVFMIHVNVVEEFNYISMEEIDTNMPLGTSITLNPRVKLCQSSSDTDVTGSWLEMDRHKGILIFNPKVFSVTDANGQTVSSGDKRPLGTTYTVKRIGEGASELTYKVEWKNSDTMKYEPVCEKYTWIHSVSYDLEFESNKYDVDLEHNATFIFESESAEITVNTNVFDCYDEADITWDLTVINNETNEEITDGYTEFENGKITLNGAVLKEQADTVALTLKATAGDITVVEQSLLVDILEERIDLPGEMYDRQEICGYRVNLSKYFTSFTRNPNFPYGWDVKYVITEVNADSKNCVIASTEDCWKIYSDVEGEYNITVKYRYQVDNDSDPDEESAFIEAEHTFKLNIAEALLRVEFDYPNDINNMLPNDEMNIGLRVRYEWMTGDGPDGRYLDDGGYTIKIAADDDGNPLYDTSALDVTVADDYMQLNVQSRDAEEGDYCIPLIVTYYLSGDEEISTHTDAWVHVTSEYYYLEITTTEGVDIENMKVGNTDINLGLYQKAAGEPENVTKDIINGYYCDVRFRLEYDKDKVQVRDGAGEVIESGKNSTKVIDELTISRISTEGSCITIIAEIQGYTENEYHEVCRKDIILNNLEYKATFSDLTGDHYTMVFTDEEHSVSINDSEIFKEYDSADLRVEWKVYAFNDGEDTEIDDGYSTTDNEYTIILSGENLATVSTPHNEGFRAEVTFEFKDGTVLLQDSFGFSLEQSENNLGWEFPDVYIIPIQSVLVPKTFNGYTRNAEHPFGADVEYSLTDVITDNTEICEVDDNYPNGTMIYAKDTGDIFVTVTYEYTFCDKRPDNGDDSSGDGDSSGDSSGDDGDGDTGGYQLLNEAAEDAPSEDDAPGETGETNNTNNTITLTFTIHVLTDVLNLWCQYPNDSNNMLLNSEMTIQTQLGHDIFDGDEKYEGVEEKDYVLEIASDDEGHVFYDTSALSVEIGEDGKTIIVTSLDKEGYYDIPLSVTCTVNAGTDEEYEVEQIIAVGVCVKERYGLIFAEGFNSGMSVGDTDDVTLKVYEFYKDENGNEVKSQITDDLSYYIYYNEDCARFTYANGDPVWTGFTKVDVIDSELKLTRIIGDGIDISIRAGHQIDLWTFETLYELDLHIENKHYDFNFNNLRDEESTWVFTDEVMTVGIDTNYADQGLTEGVTWSVNAKCYKNDSDEWAEVTEGITVVDGDIQIDGKALASQVDDINSYYYVVTVDSSRNDCPINSKEFVLRIIEPEITEYFSFKDEENLVLGNELFLNQYFDAFVRDKNHPWGEGVQGEILSVEADSSDYCDLAEAGDGWSIQALREGRTQYTVTYIVDGNYELTKDFLVTSTTDAIYMEVHYPNDVRDMLINNYKEVDVDLLYVWNHGEDDQGRVYIDDFSLTCEEGYTDTELLLVDTDDDKISLTSYESCGQTVIKIVAEADLECGILNASEVLDINICELYYYLSCNYGFDSTLYFGQQASQEFSVHKVAWNDDEISGSDIKLDTKDFRLAADYDASCIKVCDSKQNPVSSGSCSEQNDGKLLFSRAGYKNTQINIRAQVYDENENEWYDVCDMKLWTKYLDFDISTDDMRGEDGNYTWVFNYEKDIAISMYSNKFAEDYPVFAKDLTWEYEIIEGESGNAIAVNDGYSVAEDGRLILNGKILFKKLTNPKENIYCEIHVRAMYEDLLVAERGYGLLIIPCDHEGAEIIVDEAVKATCTTSGLTEGTHCARCDEAIIAQETEKALGHSWDSGVVVKEASCTENGTKAYTCSRCKTGKNETIPSKGHTVVVDKAVAATTSSTGLTEGSHCSVCKAVIQTQQITDKISDAGSADDTKPNNPSQGDANDGGASKPTDASQSNADNGGASKPNDGPQSNANNGASAKPNDGPQSNANNSGASKPNDASQSNASGNAAAGLIEGLFGNITDVVGRCLNEMLSGKTGNAGGFGSWIDLLKSDSSTGISAESGLIFGNIMTITLTLCTKVLLDGSSVPEEKSEWVNKLKNGILEYVVFLGFIGCQELLNNNQ